MAEHVCPWWLGYLLASPLRRLFSNPERILSPYLKEGMAVLEVGPGMGFFTIPIARLVGDSGHVVCVDIQEKMIRELIRRAKRAGIEKRVTAKLVSGGSLQAGELAGSFDFALAFAVVHEVPDQKQLFGEIYRVLKSGSHALLAEPRGHVSEDDFKRTLGISREVGFNVVLYPQIRGNRGALLKKD